MSVSTILELGFKIWENLGFGEKKGKLWAWVIVISLIGILLSTFFLSYSVARRNKILS